MDARISKKHIFEYLSGRVTPIERSWVEEWIKNPENKELYFNWLFEWENQSLQYAVDQSAGWEKLSLRMDALASFQEGNVVMEEAEPEIKRPDLTNGAWAIAASLLLFIGVGWVFGDSLKYKTYKTSYGETLKVNLSDGSHAYLNANTRLKVPRFGFGNTVREVELDGEAAFSVVKTKNRKRFVVTASDTVKVEVLGTEFSVFARPRETKVSLKSGSVKIDYQSHKQSKYLSMEPGDITSVSQKGNIAIAKKQNTNIATAWQEQRYIFNQTPLSEIIMMVEENFGIKVKVEDPLISQRTITGNFKTKTADDLLKTISQVLDLDILTSKSVTVIRNH